MERLSLRMNAEPLGLEDSNSLERSHILIRSLSTWIGLEQQQKKGSNSPSATLRILPMQARSCTDADTVGDRLRLQHRRVARQKPLFRETHLDAPAKHALEGVVETT